MRKKGRKVTAMLIVACLTFGGMMSNAAPFPVKAAADLQDGLVGYWSFDGVNPLTNQAPGGLTLEKTGSGVELKTDGGVFEGTAYFGKQADSNLKIPQSLNAYGDDFTIAAWIKYDSDTFTDENPVDLFQQNSEGKTLLYLKPDHTYGTYMAGGDIDFSSVADIESWHHVALTSDHATKTVRFYLNGEKVGTGELNGTVSNEITDILIGSHKNNADPKASVKGSLDELRFYKKVVSDEEAAAMYDEYAMVCELPKLVELIEEARSLEGDHDRSELDAAIAEAEGISENSEIEKLRSARTALQDAMETYKNMEKGYIRIAVNTREKLRDISDAMFGVNHRYHNNAYSTWNVQEWKIEDEFDEYAKEANFGSIRYPGGTVANLFDWKRAIGPREQRKKTIHGNTNEPIEPNFGVDEAMSWIYDDLDAEAVWVYAMGQGSASDAADLFEYLNAPADGDATNPNGGTDWAEVRKTNGHPDPYGVTRFEIGNEMGMWGQNYWVGGCGASKAYGEAYVNGGEMSFDKNTKVVREEDWRDSAANSDGSEDQVRYVKYDPVEEGSARVYVNGVEWTIVDSLENQGSKNVCTFEYPTGKICFGDGVNGNIPPTGQAITASYKTVQDGFVEYYKKLNEIADELGMEVEVYSCVDTQPAISALETAGNPYDGIVIHPYSETSSTGGGYINIDPNDPEYYEKHLGRSLEHNITRVEALIDRMAEGKVPVVSEFGILRHNIKFIRSIGHAIYIANEMIDYIGLNTPYLNKHCLVDYPYGADDLGSGSQCVIQAIKHDDGTVGFVSTPSAKMFSIFNHMTGSEQVKQDITGNGVYYTYTRDDITESYDVPTIKAISTKDGEGNTYVTVVNNEKDESTPVEITVDDRNLSGRNVEVWYLTSENVDDENTEDMPNLVDIEKTSVEVKGNSLKYNLAKHSVTSFKIPAKPDPEKDTIDGGVTANSVESEVSEKSAEFTWPVVEGADGYVIERRTSSGEKWEEVGTVTDGKYKEDSLQPGTTYYYRIRPYKMLEGQRIYFADAAVKTVTTKAVEQKKEEDPVNPQPVNPSSPAKPSKVKAKKTKKGISLSWKAVKRANGYIIYRSTKKKKGYKPIATLKKGSKKVYVDKKAKKGKTYYYKIVSYSLSGKKKIKSAYSKIVKRKR